MLTFPLSSASWTFWGGGRGTEGVNGSEQALPSSQHCGKSVLPISGLFVRSFLTLGLKAYTD